MARRRKKKIEMIVGERLRAARDEQGLSQAELSRRAKISQSNCARIESGDRSPTVGTLEKLALGLNMDLADLVTGLAKPKKPTKAEKAFYRLCDKLRDRDADFLKAVEHLIRSLESVSK